MLLDMKDAFTLLAALHDLMSDERAALALDPRAAYPLEVTFTNRKTKRWSTVYIEEADFYKPIAQLAAEIHALHTETT